MTDRLVGRLLPWAFPLLLAALPAARSFGAEDAENAPVRPEGGDYVPPPYQPVLIEGDGAGCGDRRYDLSGVVPLATVAGRPVLAEGVVFLDRQPLAPPRPRWVLKTPAVAIAERAWHHGRLRLTVRQTVEYDGFVTVDLTLAPGAGAAQLDDLALRLVYRPETSTLYQAPSNEHTIAGFWPREKILEPLFAGIWGGEDATGMACYVGTFRDWRGPNRGAVLQRDANGAGVMLLRVVTSPTELRSPVTYRFGFIATPVLLPETGHWQMYCIPPQPDELQRTVGRNLIWTALSDHYATFSTNSPDRDRDRDKVALVQEIHDRGKAALVYTTYADVENGLFEVPPEWNVVGPNGRPMRSVIDPAKRDWLRVQCCPGSRSWLQWKTKDLQTAIERYGVDGFYIDCSFVLSTCANPLHGHGWSDGGRLRQEDFPTWTMREIFRRTYEMLCQKRGKAQIFVHHLGGCPAALAAFTSISCDGEQFNFASIREMTLDAFRAQETGRNLGPPNAFLDEYYRSHYLMTRGRTEHHNPAESIMLPLVHDVMPLVPPGEHPNRELVALRDDLGIAQSAWFPYYQRDNPWRVEGPEGCVVSAYRTARNDTLLVVANAAYTPARVRLAGPAEAMRDRTFVAIDIMARRGWTIPTAVSYRWEPADPASLAVPARSFGMYAWIAGPESLAGFSQQYGFASSPAIHRRRTPLPANATLIDDFEAPDWTLSEDDGVLRTTAREPVDTMRALRVDAVPRNHAAGVLEFFDSPQDWSAAVALGFWIRPDRPLPVSALMPAIFDPKKNRGILVLVSHQAHDVLPAGRWTWLQYEFRDLPRSDVTSLYIYHNHNRLNSGPYDLDEMLLFGRDAPPAQTPRAAGPRPFPDAAPGKTGR